MADPTPTHSTSPNGEEFPLPVEADYHEIAKFEIGDSH